MTPPGLSADSADRLAAVHATADSAVDAGSEPDAAIAKAAVEFGMPAGHVPLVVRAFNTARAVRQLAEGDAWSKAASYPTATVDGVLKALEVKPPAPRSKASADYLFRPGQRKVVEPKVARTKAAAAPAAPAPKPEPKPKPADNRLSLQFQAAAAFDKAARALAGLPPAQYAGVRAVSARLYPHTAPFLFGLVEGDDAFAKKASARPSPVVGVDHPTVALVGELDAVRARYVPGRPAAAPEGYRKVASEPGVDLYVKVPTCPITGVYLYPSKAAEKAAAAVEAPAPAGPLPVATPAPAPLDVTRQASAPDAADPEKAAGLMSGFAATGVNPLKALGQSPLMGPVVDGLKVKSDGGAASAAKLKTDLGRLDSQAALQAMLEDPRFAKADPALMMKTYRELNGLAPLSMANPLIAGDYVQRRLTTGPMSYFDLKALTDIEHNLTRIQGARKPDDDEDDL